MQSKAPSSPFAHLPVTRALILCCAASLSGCDVFDEALEARIDAAAVMPPAAMSECTRHADCPQQTPTACVKPEGRCVALLSEDCTVVTGPIAQPGSDEAIVIGSMFSTTGPQAQTNLPRQQSAILAVEELNRAGGIPSPAGPGKGRPLVLVSCDEVADLRRAGTHLVSQLKVPAIIGPNTSQDVLDLSNGVSVQGGTLLLSPTGVASSIADLRDDDLTWVMVPSDVQRAPLMRQQIGELEAQLKESRDKDVIKLSVIYRDDALGIGTRVSLNSLVLNGKPLPEQATVDGNIKIDRYVIDQSDRSSLVESQLAFAPDIVVLVGTAEAITQIMKPLEQRWVGADRPYYVMIDSARNPELLEAVTGNDELRVRVRGTGMVATTRSQPVYDAFRVGFSARFPDARSDIFGLGPTYDATYAVALALAATYDQPVSGKSIAQGLRKLSGGDELELQSTNVLAAMTLLTAGKSIDAVGTFAPLQWDERGAPVGGRVEVWCIAGGAMPRFASSGLTHDLKTNRFSGYYQQCN